MRGFEIIGVFSTLGRGVAGTVSSISFVSLEVRENMSIWPNTWVLLLAFSFSIFQVISVVAHSYLQSQSMVPAIIKYSIARLPATFKHPMYKIIQVFKISPFLFFHPQLL
jgi:hypothetical protein